eukprot:TRINITY_DN9917_c0_g1_i1.p1 TRINITY_DN9917_c0_g1~~TRINITY_DN9917_c0_g1_i1.p1  ORF type:complete len:205 (-),score=32.14 TRINITY_DN9917_c0_g1_i1:4-618(-)
MMETYCNNKEGKEEAARNYSKDNDSRELFGGAMLIQIPPQFEDVSDIREIPDNQEVFTNIDQDQTIIIEITETAKKVDLADLARFNFDQLASDNEAKESKVLETFILPQDAMPNLSGHEFQLCGLKGTQTIAKFNETAHNTVHIHLVVLRLPEVEAEIVFTLNVPVEISPESSSFKSAPVGSSHFDMTSALSSFRINDWTVFEN